VQRPQLDVCSLADPGSSLCSDYRLQGKFTIASSGRRTTVYWQERAGYLLVSDKELNTKSKRRKQDDRPGNNQGSRREVDGEMAMRRQVGFVLQLLV
jgi:hypothetical protein